MTIQGEVLYFSQLKEKHKLNLENNIIHPFSNRNNTTNFESNSNMKSIKESLPNMNNPKMKKIATYSVATAVILALGSNFFLSVKAGDVAAESEFGGKIVLTKHYKEGLHFPVNPFSSFIHMSVKDESISLKGISIDNRGNAVSNGRLVLQTADQMTTGVDVEILLQMKPEFVPHFVQQAGTFNGSVNKYINPALLESLMIQGAVIESAQDLFTTKAKESLKLGTMQDMVSYLEKPSIMGKLANGFTIKDVKYQRMVLPPRIQEMINQAKEREEQENVAESNEEIAKTNADAKFYEEQQLALADQERANAEAHRLTVLATAAEKEADAKFYAMDKESSGIKLINAQLTPRYNDYIYAQASLTASQKYKGGTPSSLTIMDGNTSAVPYMNIGKK